MIYELKHTRIALLAALVILGVLFSGQSFGRQENYFCSVRYKDSIAIELHSRVLYNNVYITNTYKQPITLQISMITPEGWRMLSDENISLSLAPGEKQMLPLAIMKYPNALALWQPVFIHIRLQNSTDTALYSFYIKANSLSRFKVFTKVDNISVSDSNREFCIPLKITNSGSVPAIYTIAWQCKSLELAEKVAMPLPPQRDTEYTYCVNIADSKWPDFKKDELILKMTDTAGNSFEHVFHVGRTANEMEMYPSKFATFPLTLQGGIMNADKEVAYFGAIHGEMLFDNKDKLNFAYRSKQFGTYNQFDRDVWHAEYITKKWTFYGGTINDTRFFALYNNGAKVTYRWQENGELSLAGSLHEKQFGNMYYYNNDNVTATLKYALDKMVLAHAFSANFDAVQRLNSYIFWNSVRLLKNKTTSLEVTGGTGLDQSTYHFTGIPRELWGTSLGYIFLYNGHNWNIMSNMEENSDNYPGLKKGLRLQNHYVNRQIDKVRLGLFYESNYMRSNFFRDTLYRSDVFTNNVTKYGVRTGWAGKKMGVGLSLGLLNQEGVSNSIGEQYPYADLTYSYNTKDIHFLVSSLNGYSNKNGATTDDVYITNTSIQLNNKFWGVQGIYVRSPIVQPLDKVKPITGYDETVSGTTYMNFKIRKYFSGRLQYSISKSLYDNSVLSFLGGNLNYNNDRNGLSVSLYGNVPLQTVQEAIPGLNRRYLSLAVSKRFNMPVFVQRKYFDLKVVAYYDENGNGIMDGNEMRLANIFIDVNGLLFQTDAQGAFFYENIEKGTYTIDLHGVKNIKGMIPTLGFIQKVKVDENTTYMIPFKKSKLISGNIKVILDSLSPAHFTPDYIKITATDTAGATFMTATDDNGEYYFNLPSGIYSLSLNPKAFNDVIRPLKVSYKIDLINNNEAIVVFEIDQKNREIRMRTFKID